MVRLLKLAKKLSLYSFRMSCDRIRVNVAASPQLAHQARSLARDICCDCMSVYKYVWPTLICLVVVVVPCVPSIAPIGSAAFTHFQTRRGTRGFGSSPSRVSSSRRPCKQRHCALIVDVAASCVTEQKKNNQNTWTGRIVASRRALILYIHTWMDRSNYSSESSPVLCKVFVYICLVL